MCLIKRSFIFCLILNAFFTTFLPAQQTVGLFQNDSTTNDGYVLFYPSGSEYTYLIDNCGSLMHSWQGTARAGLSAYLLADGRLLRAERVNSNFTGGGTGGKVIMLDWDGNLIWEYLYSSELVQQHHDIAFLPTGNILLIAWELKTEEEAIEAGRIPQGVTVQGFWPDHIVELEPIGFDSANIVWEWHVWDHLVQDIDETKNNFGVIAEHPELIDINFEGNFGAGVNPDFNHCNSIAYNADWDQIIINSRNFNEFWIIDHSTTTVEAAGHSGGIRGKGGDLLYRWGNPQAYGRGTAIDEKFYGQHDAHWIPEGMPDAGKIMVFNNGFGRPGPDFSTVDILDIEVTSEGNYFIDEENPFGPSELFSSYQADPPTDFYSSRTSSGQQLENGNILICEGRRGLFYEVDTSGNRVWEYINPVGNGGPVTQGMNNPTGSTFRAKRYALDYPAFIGKDLTPGDPIELAPLPSICDESTALEAVQESLILNLFPNPMTDILHLENPNALDLEIKLRNNLGQIIGKYQSQEPFISLAHGIKSSGMILVEITDLLTQQKTIERVVIR